MNRITKLKQGYKKVNWYFGKEIEIPKEWKYVQIENLCNKITSGGTPHRNNPEYYKGKIRWIKSGELKDNFISNSEEKITQFGLTKSSAKLFPKNTVLIAMYGATIGKTAIIEKESATNQAICAILPNRSFDSFYLQQLIIYQRNILISFGMGAGQPNINQETIKTFHISIPSLFEQQKIASILSGVDALIESTQNVIDKTERLKKGLMQRLLTRGMGHTKFKKLLMRYHFIKLTIPKNWQVQSIKELSTLKKDAVITGPFGLMLHSSDYVDKGTPLILIKNIKDGKINESNIPKISKEDAKRLSRYRVVREDLVFSRVGRVGSAALIEQDQEGWLISGQTLRIRFKNPSLNPYFVNYFIHSQLFVRSLIPELLGSTRDSINTTILKNLLILIPTFTEQTKIASILSGVDASIQKNRQYKEKLERLKKGLMQKLLTGQIRVKG